MPQYLAVDYLPDLMCQKQANLSQMLIACPPHILKFNKTTDIDKFAYRQPWLKGVPVINSKEFVSKTKEELSMLYSKTSCFKSYLQFNEVQYHYTFEKFEEIIPNSNPNSDAEMYDVKTLKTKAPQTASCGFISASEKDIDEIFSAISVEDYAHTLSEDNINLCKDPLCCKLIEPLLTFCTLENGLPDLYMLLSKLNIMTIPDPTGDVDFVIDELFYQDKQLSYSEPATVASSNSDSNTENLSLSPYHVQDYELVLDFLEAGNAMLENKTISTTHCLGPEAEDSQFPKHHNKDLHSVFELCKNGIHKLPNQKSSDEDVTKMKYCKLEKMTLDCNLHPSSLQLLLDEPTICSTNYEEQMQLELPLAPDATVGIVESSSKAALCALEIKNENLPSVCELNKSLSQATQLKHLRELEKIPNVCGGNSLFKYFIPEPAVEQSFVNVECNIKNYIDEAYEVCSPQAEPHWDGSDLELSWDPISHASDDMAFVRRSLRHESYKLAAFYSSASLTLDNRSEEFIPIQLNESLERNIALETDYEAKEKVFDSCQVTSPTKYSENTITASDILPSSKCNQGKVDVYATSQCATMTSIKSVVSASSIAKAPHEASSKHLAVLSRSAQGCDPLADFMLLIGKRQQSDLPWVKANDTSSNATVTGKNYQSNNENLSIKRVRSANQSSPAMLANLCEENPIHCPSKKPKQSLPRKLGPPGMMTCGEIATKENLSKTIQVYITGKALDIIYMVERESAPILRELQVKKLLPYNASLINITREASRFMVKQHHKAILDKEARGETTDRIDILLLQIFHQVISTFYLLVHVSFTSGLALLHTSMQQLERDETINYLPNFHLHVEVFKKLIQNLRFYMCNSISGVSDQTLLIHPKIFELQSFLHKWFSKRRTSNVTENPKAVVICCTYCRYLFSKLCREMNKPVETGVALKAVSVAGDATELSNSDIHRIFERTNVLIIAEQMLFEDFPWQSLSLVVDYEHRSDSPWKRLSSNYKIKHVSLQAILPSTSVDLEDDKMSKETQKSGFRFSESSQNVLKQPFVLIGSTKVTSMGNLLHLLETRYDLLVIERDYSVLGESALSHPDIIVDGNMGILLEDMENLQKEGGDFVRAILAILLAIRARLSYCLIIMTPKQVGMNPDHGRPHCGTTQQNLARMSAAIKKLSNSCNDFEVKMLCCLTVEDIASTIVEAIPRDLMSNYYNADKDTANRSFLSSQMSKHEHFLLRFPCINSLVAQSLLSAATLEGICRMNVDQIISHSSTLSIPRRIAESIVLCLSQVYQGPEQRNVDTAGEVMEADVSSYDDHKHARDASSDHRRELAIACEKESEHFAMNTPSTSTGVKNLPVSQQVQRIDDSWPGHGLIDEKLKLNQLIEPRPAPSSWCKETIPSTRLFNQIDPSNVKLEQQYHPGSDAFYERDCHFPLVSDGPAHSSAANEYNQFSGSDLKDDTIPARDDVRDMMVSARNKLTEFVLNNPGRAVASSSRNYEVESNPSHFHQPYADPFHKQNTSNALCRYSNTNSTGVPWKHNRHEITHNTSCNQLFQPTEFQASFGETPADFSSNLHAIMRSHNDHLSRDERFESFSKQMSGLMEKEDTAPKMIKEQSDANLTLIDLLQHLGGTAVRDEVSCTAGTSGSVNIGIAQPFSQQPYRGRHLCRSEYGSSHGCPSQFFRYQSHNSFDEMREKPFAVVMTPNERKKMLTYEKVPGRKGGQTRLTFY